jgi:hypothetical protein
MTTKIFVAACEALWGPHYQSPGARELGLALRTMTRYAAGDRAVPPAVMLALGQLLAQRSALIARLIPKVVAAAEGEA